MVLGGRKNTKTKTKTKREADYCKEQRCEEACTKESTAGMQHRSWMGSSAPVAVACGLGLSWQGSMIHNTPSIPNIQYCVLYVVYYCTPTIYIRRVHLDRSDKGLRTSCMGGSGLDQ